MIVLVIEAFVNEIENFDNQKLTTDRLLPKALITQLPDKNGSHAPLEN